MNQVEQVRAPRVEFPGETIVYVGNRQVVCEAINLSASGMLISERTRASPPLQLQRGQFTRLVFSLRTESGRFIDVDAVVVRVATERPRAWGLQFISLPTHITAEIGAYVGNRITEAARAAGRRARQSNEARWRATVRDVTPADLLDASGSHDFGEDETPLRELYREALEQVVKEDESEARKRRR